jgi:GDP/UDP-N,N'-diacetylbacillosamine 2-epimerase (hydrolysing)
MKKKVCVITGSRAEYGLLRWVMQEILDDPELTLQVVATGMHLSPEFGMTYKAIEDDGFRIDRKVEMLLSSDTSVAVTKSMGLGIIGFGDVLGELSPDLVMVLGDRFEIFSAAQAAMILQIPIAHLAGGDNGHGTYDNIIRHCITKMASLHFVTHMEAYHRVIQLGENPQRVFCYGATSVDNFRKLNLLSRKELERELDISLEKKYFLVTFHPLTMDSSESETQLKALLNVLSSYVCSGAYLVIFTKSNADNGGRAINSIIENFVQNHDECYLFDSLGQVRYLSALKHAYMVIGNSSSGVYEAPYMNIPTVNIGSRQLGRPAPTSVLHCEPNESSILRAIEDAQFLNFKEVEMLYGDGAASRKIIRKVKEFIGKSDLAVKEFVDLRLRDVS